MSIAHTESARSFPWWIVVIFALGGLMIAALSFNQSRAHTHGPSADNSHIYVFAAEKESSPRSIEEMTLRADVVVRGTVASVDPGRVLDFNNPEEDPLQIVDVVLRVESVLSGSTSSDLVAIEWMAWYDEIASGRQIPIIVNGIEMPEVGTEMIWFVQTTPDETTQAVPMFGLVSLDGMLTVSNGRVFSTIESGEGGDKRLGAEISGTRVDDLRLSIEASR